MAFSEYNLEYKLTPKVSIYIPKKNGKPCVKTVCRWYVYFYYKDNGKNKIFKKYADINRYKTARDRLKAAKHLKKAIESYLNDSKNSLFDLIHKDRSVANAVQFAFNEKKKQWKKSSLRSAKSYLDKFIGWLNRNNLAELPVKQFKKQFIIAYLSELQNDLSNVSVNNNKRFLHNIFKKLSQNGIIEYNPVADLPTLAETPTKHKVFDDDMLNKLQAYIKETDPILYNYIQFMSYTFMRPVEIVRLRVGDIDMKKNVIYSNTKTGKQIIPIIEKLKPILQNFELDKHQPDDILFTNLGVPYGWDLSATDESRYIYFKEHFYKVKQSLGLGREYGLYSFRHTFAKMLYNKYLADGLTDLQAKQKLMTITRHKSISSLNKYLRNIGAFVPKDYSDDFTFDF